MDLGLFLGLSLIPGVHYLVANGISKLGGAATGFLLHKYLTFRWIQRDRVIVQIWSYAALFLFNLLLGNGLLYFGVQVLSLPETQYAPCRATRP